MASSKDRERKLARAKIDRQQARRAHQVQSQRQVQARIGAAVAIIVVAAVVGVATHWYGITSSKPTPIAQCVWTPVTSSNPAYKDTKDVGTPPTKGLTMAGQQAMTITTNQGTVDANIEVTQAPCTAASFTYLASKKFFDNTNCHRLTNAGLFVLQCGDPTGTGSGGPRYTIPDENLPLTDNVGAPSAAASAPTDVVYKAGTIAMANSGTNTGSSQFFLVYKDSPLPATYPIIGTIDAAGLAVINKIAAGGVGPGGTNANDGPPKITTTIQTLTMGEITPAPTPSASTTPSTSPSTPATSASPSSNS